MFLNLNHECFKIGDLPNGKTQNIELKIGQKLYYVDIDKNHNSASLDFYKKNKTDRIKQSKYSSNGVLTVFIKTDAILNRKFFEEINNIKKAQEIYDKWGDKIK